MKKLFEIFQELSTLKADGENKHFQYNYITIEQIKKVFHEIFARKGILFIFEVIDFTNEQLANGILTTIKCQAKFFDVETGESVIIQNAGMGFDNQGKSLAKAKSDALKRIFSDMFLIGIEDEDDEKEYGKIEEKTNFVGREDAITPAQINKIWRVTKEKGYNTDTVHTMLQQLIGKKSLKELSIKEASQLISHLEGE